MAVHAVRFECQLDWLDVDFVGAVAVQPVAEAAGAVDNSVTMYPVTPTLSVAVRLEIETARELEVVEIVNPVTEGAVVSATGAGPLFASPGKVLALISTILEEPSPSESRPSRAALKVRFPTAPFAKSLENWF